MDVKDFYFSYFQAGNISIDSRKIEKETIFFAFSGESFDAATKAED
ncbi:MAG: UDP-N-acetylmuramoyl-tripeptide--D-alanyl-D-alanine ligase, partial [Flavobacteriaceae bacterium]|nr:UDP-N-acetylmuramoyl-tripeptide--D-alanyl-D-alanine ligase [Flavobacteriaceae bacterium]